MSKFKDVGDISLWNNNRGTSEKSPTLTGDVEIEGRKYRVALWNNQSDNPKAPRLKGKISVEEGWS